MINYLLDTHIFIWLLTDSDKLNNNIREDIEYFQHPCYVSIETLHEVVILQSLKKITLDYSLEKIVDYLKTTQIQILPLEINHVKALGKLPTNRIDKQIHDDPFDRMLIAQAIAEKLTIISSDGKFPPYCDYGLKLLVNKK
ncbi:MAG: type II toxin-antitoxin system VapC family toxin [Dysgonamonadaceae bacterium]|jgi:PIN domain nuclease of toxin-antitoxin system|nr:type II toxin-antitoxin system VapC family toxin [Dysgonamonadaceae bacterium]